MIVRRFYDSMLAQASYLVGCGRTGNAIVIDANRDVEQYVAAAAREGVRITHVTETHIHADFVSGTRELAQRTGATMYLSDEGGSAWKYGFASADGAIPVRDGDRIDVGNVVVQAVHTPGHTPEHLSFLVTDGATADEPMAIVTGDFVFVGDVGRPDLLEKAAKVAGSMEQSARALYASLQAFAKLPDWLQVWPGHGAGSACGKGLSAVPHSTVGYERRHNWAFRAQDEADFVRSALAGQPEAPTYFAQMKRVNRDGPALLGGFPRPPKLASGELRARLDAGALVIDTRPAAAFATGHVPGAISIPLNGSFGTWAGWLLPYDRDLHLIVDASVDVSPSAIEQAVRTLVMIGFDRIAGWFDAESVGEWTRAGEALQAVPQLGARDVASRLQVGTVHVLDVRARSEWEAGHLPGVANIHLGHLAERLGELPRDRTVVLQCQGGSRSGIAAGLLQAHGFTDVANLAGGFDAWQTGGLPVRRGNG